MEQYETFDPKITEKDIQSKLFESWGVQYDIIIKTRVFNEILYECSLLSDIKNKNSEEYISGLKPFRQAMGRFYSRLFRRLPVYLQDEAEDEGIELEVRIGPYGGETYGLELGIIELKIKSDVFIEKSQLESWLQQNIQTEMDGLKKFMSGRGIFSEAKVEKFVSIEVDKIWKEINSNGQNPK